MNSPLALLRSRTIRFQLTSLMDLLLIIVFAQYLEFHQSHGLTEAEKQREIASARAAVESAYEQKSAQLDQLRADVSAQAESLRRERDDAVVTAQEAQTRLALADDLMRRLLQVDPELVDVDLSPAEAIETLNGAESVAASIQEAEGTELLRFLVGYDELMKRAEVWTVHVSNRGDIELQAGRDNVHRHSFRLEEPTQVGRSDEFVRLLRAAYTQIPQPKGLVVILVSYSPRAVAGNYQPALDGMPSAIEQLTQDAAGRTRFEYAVIGAITDPARDLSELGP